MIIQIEPWIDDGELKEVSEVVKSTFITENKKTKEFEGMFKELVKSQFVHAFCNGTATLYTSLKILGIGEGDEVIVPAMTFTATINPIILAGAKPVLVDIDKETMCMDVSKIREKITDKTKAIMPVHLYGQSVDMDELMKIAKENNLKVVEDAAQGVGVTFNGKHVGTFGDTGSFSFYGNKTITTGEGGMLVTDNSNLSDDAYRFKNHGRLKKGTFIHEKIGFNFSTTEMQSAIGVAQMRKLPEIKRRKNRLREMYEKELSSIESVNFPKVDSRCDPLFWFTNIFVDNAEEFSMKMREKEVQTRRAFYPIHKQPCYSDEDFVKGEFPNTDWVYEHLISLPSSATLSDEDHQKVCEAVKEVLQ